MDVVNMFSKILIPRWVVRTKAALPLRGIKRLGSSPANLVSNVISKSYRALLTQEDLVTLPDVSTSNFVGI